jgi:hypothetical protein
MDRDTNSYYFTNQILDNERALRILEEVIENKYFHDYMLRELIHDYRNKNN